MEHILKRPESTKSAIRLELFSTIPAPIAVSISDPSTNSKPWKAKGLLCYAQLPCTILSKRSHIVDKASFGSYGLYNYADQAPVLLHEP
jgi:hypothetical protein